MASASAFLVCILQLLFCCGCVIGFSFALLSCKLNQIDAYTQTPVLLLTHPADRL